jgi:hypothetical protein
MRWGAGRVKDFVERPGAEGLAAIGRPGATPTGHSSALHRERHGAVVVAGVPQAGTRSRPRVLGNTTARARPPLPPPAPRPPSPRPAAPRRASGSRSGIGASRHRHRSATGRPRSPPLAAAPRPDAATGSWPTRRRRPPRARRRPRGRGCARPSAGGYGGARRGRPRRGGIPEGEDVTGTGHDASAADHVVGGRGRTRGRRRHVS